MSIRLHDVPGDEDFVMPWGKYEGQEMGELPSGYLVWLFENCSDDAIRDLAREEWEWRRDSNLTR